MLKKRAFAVLAAMVLCVSLAFTGCGSNPNQQQSSTKEQQTQAGKSEQAQNTTQEVKVDPFEKYEPAIELTTVRDNPNPPIKYEREGDSIDNNSWTKAYQEQLGINTKYLWTCDSSQYDQKRNLMIASGEIPDFFLATPTLFQQLADAGMLADLTDVYNKYASEQTRLVMNDSGTEVIESATYKGKLLALPFTGMAKDAQVHMIYVRTDWLKKLNLSEPKTMDDVLKIAEAFAKKDPDGNGKDDTIGLLMDKDFGDTSLGKTQNGFFNGFHAYPGIWIKDASGSLVYGSIQPEVKKALLKLQELYKNKIIEKDFAVKNAVKAFEAISAGKCGLMFTTFDAPPFPLQASKDNNPNAEWQAYPLVSIDDKPALTQHNLGLFGYWVVSKNCKNPEAVVKMTNLWFKYFYFNTDDSLVKVYVAGGNGTDYWKDSLVQAYMPTFQINAGKNIRGVYAGTVKMEDISPNERTVKLNIDKYLAGDKSMWWYNEVWGENGTTTVSKYYLDNNFYMVDQFYGAPTSNMVEKNATLKQKEAEVFVKIIVGESIDEFDKFVKDWAKMGGEQITKEVNEWNEKKK